MSEHHTTALIVELGLLIVLLERLHIHDLRQYLFLRIWVGIYQRNLVTESYFLWHFCLLFSFFFTNLDIIPVAVYPDAVALALDATSEAIFATLIITLVK